MDHPSLEEQRAADRVAASAAHADHVRRKKPSWEDYVREGVIDRVPEPSGPDGTIQEATVKGNAAVVRMLEMQMERYRADTEYYDGLHAQIPHVRIKDARGRVRHVKERDADRIGRKFGVSRRSFSLPQHLKGWQYRCGAGHAFGFLPGKPDADTRPCIRTGCTLLAYREPA